MMLPVPGPLASMMAALLAHSSSVDGSPSEQMSPSLAREEALRLVPIVADDVIDGRRWFLSTLPPSAYLGVGYSFRLRAQPVRYQPYCERRSLMLSLWFREPRLTRPALDQLDVISLKKAGAFHISRVYVSTQFLALSPEPSSAGEHEQRCKASEGASGWVEAEDENEFRSELWYLRQVETALATAPRKVSVSCTRDTKPCQISRNALLRLLSSKRVSFEHVYMADGTEMAEFTYPIEEGRSRAIVIRLRKGTVQSISFIARQVPTIVI